METNTNQAPIEQLRKCEDEQRIRAEVARQGINQITQLTEEARTADDNFQQWSQYTENQVID